MAQLTSDDLDEIRASIESLLPDTCNILSGTRVSDGRGGGSVTWGTATAGVACRLDSQGGNEQYTAGAIQPYTKWMLTLPWDTTITNQNRVEVGTTTYNVVGGVNTGASWIGCKRVVLEKL